MNDLATSSISIAIQFSIHVYSTDNTLLSSVADHNHMDVNVHVMYMYITCMESVPNPCILHETST